MIYLYAAKVNNLFDLYENHRDIFQEKMSLLCPERKKKVEAVKQPKDKARALGAGILLQSALQDYLSLSVCKKDCGHRKEEALEKAFVFDEETFQNARPMRHMDIAYGEKGKPYLPEFPGLYFSLSHSGDYVALALSCHPVGVDIQEKRELSDALQMKYFTEEERKSGYAPFAVFSGKESYIKFTGEGGRITLTTESAAEGIAVTVRDNGCGVPPEDRGKIFDRFFTADRAHTAGKGTGLGLSICQRILEMHGREIRLMDTDEGAAFRFTLERGASPAKGGNGG